MTTKEQLSARIAELEAMIEPIQNERSELKQRLIELKSKFKPGDIISWNDGKRKGRVIKIIPWVCGDPMWGVVNIRKDGTEGSVCKVHPYQNPKRL